MNILKEKVNNSAGVEQGFVEYLLKIHLFNK